MFNILELFYKVNNKNHVSMILVLLTLLLIIPVKINAKMADYSKFDWDNYYENNKYIFGQTCSNADTDENGYCKEDTLLMGQKKFFVRTYKILAKYQNKGLVISDDLVITTALFGLAGEQTGNEIGNEEYKRSYYNKKEGELKAGIIVDDNFNEDDFDADDKFDDNNDSTVSEDEDTALVLIKNSIAYYTYCYGIYGDPTETTASDGSKLYTCPDGGTLTKIHYLENLIPSTKTKCAVNLSATTGASGYELGFWDYTKSRLLHRNKATEALSLFGLKSQDEYYDQCMEAASQYTEGTEYQYTDQENKVGRHISNTKYFDFLKTSNYFDRKPHLQNYFSDVLKEAEVSCLTSNVCDNSLEAKGEYEQYEEKLQADRLEIIHRIIDTLNENGIAMQYDGYGAQEFSDASYSTNDRESFFWPIGSEEVSSKDLDGTSITFAAGTPQYTLDNVTSYYGNRRNPITNVEEMHYGIDIGVPEGTNIIAAFEGTVLSIYSSCTSGDYECNEGYGNTVIISHKNGDYTVYAHLSSIDSQIFVGSTVLRGEIIGKSGSTGETKEPNLYYELRTGGNSVSSAVDPITNTSAGRNSPPKDEDLRPIGQNSSGVGARSTRFDGTHLTMTEFSMRVKAYCSSHSGIAQAMCDNPDLVYEASKTYNVNPELVITRAMAEGNSPGIAKNNYWGMGCTNTGGYQACITYSSLQDGIKGFAGMVTKYNNLMEMQLKYAYIGRYWYNPGSWSVGGCKYFPYIQGYMSPQRQSEVTQICAKQSECTTKGGDCTPTIQEDQNAYATWQVEKKLGPYMNNVFGT